MDTWTIVGSLLLVGIVFYWFWSAGAAKSDDSTSVFPRSIPGDTQQSSSVALPRAFNQPEGLTYAYSGWLLVKDFTTGYGTKRRIFSKDDAPGLYLDSTSNSLLVAVKTYGTTETILIPNIPAMKWMHIGLSIDQHAVDIYINGMLRQHHTLSQLPMQNDAVVTAGPGWNGVLSNLVYYARSLTHEEIRKLSREPPPDDLERRPSGPQYFDITWYIGRLYSV
jgi:hypothetical protein